MVHSSGSSSRRRRLLSDSTSDTLDPSDEATSIILATLLPSPDTGAGSATESYYNSLTPVGASSYGGTSRGARRALLQSTNVLSTQAAAMGAVITASLGATGVTSAILGLVATNAAAGYLQVSERRDGAGVGAICLPLYPV